MPAINFMPQFAPLIESGEKTQTIRKVRKKLQKIKVGDTLYLYTGQRTKACRMIRTTRCVCATPIEISRSALSAFVVLGNDQLSLQERLRLAQADGFDTAAEFVGFFEENYGLPFHGVLIKWGDV